MSYIRVHTYMTSLSNECKVWIVCFDLLLVYSWPAILFQYKLLQYSIYLSPSKGLNLGLPNTSQMLLPLSNLMYIII